jgi:hypothetical protein
MEFSFFFNMWLCRGFSVFLPVFGVLVVLHPINLRLYGRDVGGEIGHPQESKQGKYERGILQKAATMRHIPRIFLPFYF